MSKLRRSLALAAVVSLAMSAQSWSASADEVGVVAQGEAPVADPQVAPVAAHVARGLIVQTTSTVASDSLLEATGDALDAGTDVAGSDRLTGSISTIEFVDEVPADVAVRAAAEIEKRADVVWAVPDTLRRATAATSVKPKDPLSSQQWGLSSRFGIKAPALWPATRGKGVRVAVIDTGIAPHSELRGQTVKGYDMIAADHHGGRKTYVGAGDGTGRDSNATDPGDWVRANRCYRSSPAQDSSWHGTFIAGQIAAAADNNRGIAGAAPGVKIQPVRVLGHCGGWDSDILAGITWASGGHVTGVPDNKTPSQVLNLSLGGSYTTRKATLRACRPFAAAARAAAKRHAIIIASAGNEGGNADHTVPASCPGFVSVGAVSRKGFRAQYSNIGSTVDISAPGGDSFVAGSGDRIVSTSNSGRRSASHSSYARYEGTSMAAAYVSAGAALMYAVGLEEPAQVESGLRRSVSRFGPGPTKYRKRYHGRTYVLNLHCGHGDCGTGVLDLTKVQAAAGPLGIGGVLHEGHAVVGERLTASEPRVGPRVSYQWYREPLDGSGGRTRLGTSAVYVPTMADVGHAITVASRPTGPWSGLSSQVSTLSAVAGPDVVISYPESSHEQGTTFPVTVTISPRDGVDGVVEDGPVDVLYQEHVVAAGTTVDGVATVQVTASAWRPGPFAIRGRYLGTSVTQPGTSISRRVTGLLARASVTATVTSPVSGTSTATVTVTVATPPDADPVGAIVISDSAGRSYVETKLRAADHGTRKVTLPQLAPGTYALVAEFYGAGRAVGKAQTQTLVVSEAG